MDLSDYEAHAHYWQRQAEIKPDNDAILVMRIMAVADYIIQAATISYFNPEE